MNARPYFMSIATHVVQQICEMDMHFRWKLPNMVLTGFEVCWIKINKWIKNREASSQIYFCIRYLLPCVCLACLSIFMYISAKLRQQYLRNLHIYLCIYSCTYVYSSWNQEVVGSAPTRGEPFQVSRNFRFRVFNYDTSISVIIK